MAALAFRGAEILGRSEWTVRAPDAAAISAGAPAPRAPADLIRLLQRPWSPIVFRPDPLAAALARLDVRLPEATIPLRDVARVLLPQVAAVSEESLSAWAGISVEHSLSLTQRLDALHLAFIGLLDRAMHLDAATLGGLAALWPGDPHGAGRLFRTLAALRGIEPSESVRAIADSVLARTIDLQANARTVRLEPAESTRRVPVSASMEYLGPEGRCERSLPGFEQRPQQLRMAEAVLDTLNDGGTLLAEAGTGVGKSLAYLTPAILFATTNDCRVLVSTNTINLQDQLVEKDLPQLALAARSAFRFAVIKGRPNYVCGQRWQIMARRPDLTDAERLSLSRILVWMGETATGDVAEIDLDDDERRVWAKICSSADTCSGRRCNAAGRRGCFTYVARERGAAAHVLVVNHALLLSDLAVQNALIPECDRLIVDEAHHLESQATTHLGYSASFRALSDLIDAVSAVGADRRAGLVSEVPQQLRVSRVASAVRSEIERHLGEISRVAERSREAAAVTFAAAEGLVRALSGSDTSLRLTARVREHERFADLVRGWDDLSVELSDLQARIERLALIVATLQNDDIPEFEAMVASIESIVARIQETRLNLGGIVASGDTSTVAWAGRSGTEVTLNRAPLDVAPMLQERLFARKTSAILTSATLSSDDDFRFVRRSLGLEGARGISLGSPFDYEDAALLALPTDMRLPEESGYAAALSQSLTDVAIAADGRTLALFTSHAQLRETWRAIREPLASRQITVLAHGVDGLSRQQLLEAFRRDSRSILLGAASFWEGIDVVGDALSVVAICRLPFPVPTDPIQAARAELFERPFEQYSLPNAVLRWRQGFGRLIRSHTDRGVAICYDRRILARSYGATFINALPPASQRRLTLAALPGAVREWLRQSPGRDAPR
ncbi:MAG: hypothetical protein FJ033_02900 [Chloroflexi bacterium]|nr:hypothetical protein [Chloroflexota bacterium]